MVYTMLSALVAVCSLGDSLSSNYVGIKMGQNVSFFLKDGRNDNIKNYPRIGFAGGFFANQNLGPVGFREEFLINEKHFKMIEYGTPLDISVRTITIPILLRFRDYRHTVQFNFNIGASMEVIVRDVYGLHENGKYVTHSSDFLNWLTFGIPIGFGVDYLTRKGIFSAELRNTIDITRSTGLERFDVIYLLVGYGFAYPHYILQREITEY